MLSQSLFIFLTFFVPFYLFIFQNTNACRCDEERNCISTPLPYGVNLTLCIFSPDSFSLVGVTSLSLTQGDVVLDILGDANETAVTQSCLDDSCVLEFPLGDSVYGNNETSATIMGVAALQHDGRRQLTVRAELDFATEITLETVTTDIVGETDGNNGDGDQVDNPSGRRSNNDTSKVAWLFPLMAVSFVAFICVVIVVRKRNQQRAGRADSRTSSV